MNKKFNKIAALINSEYDGYITSATKAITEGNDDRLRAYSTDTRRRQYENGTISREQYINYAIARKVKALNRSREKELARLAELENAPAVREISIDVQWTRSRAWGYNPTARVQVWTDGGYYEATGHASGCNYDKRSAAVGQALNQIPAVIAALCAVKEANITEENTTSNKCIGYGAGYCSIPYFEGGVGINCHISMFEKCGFKKTADHGTKYTDYYAFERVNG